MSYAIIKTKDGGRRVTIDNPLGSGWILFDSSGELIDHEFHVLSFDGSLTESQLERKKQREQEAQKRWNEQTKKLPGNMLAYMIAQACDIESVGCGSACPERQAQMNEWSWLKCATTKLPTIIGWLNEERKNRGLEPDAAMARKAVRAAIAYLRSNAARDEHGGM